MAVRQDMVVGIHHTGMLVQITVITKVVLNKTKPQSFLYENPYLLPKENRIKFGSESHEGYVRVVVSMIKELQNDWQK